jgi:hypothetical protein
MLLMLLLMGRGGGRSCWVLVLLLLPLLSPLLLPLLSPTTINYRTKRRPPTVSPLMLSWNLDGKGKGSFLSRSSSAALGVALAAALALALALTETDNQTRRNTAGRRRGRGLRTPAMISWRFLLGAVGAPHLLAVPKGDFCNFLTTTWSLTNQANQ